MPKQKTHKGLAKRVKVTGSGKILRHHSGTSHLLSNKNSKRRRRLGSSAVMVGKKAATARILLGV